MPKFRKEFCTIALASLCAMSIEAFASPVVVYDSSSAYEYNTPNPNATSGYNGNLTTHDTDAYAANRVVEIGGEIALAGTERVGSSATVQFRTGPNGSAAISGSVPFTLNFYADNAGTIGALLGSVTTTVVTPAGTGDVKATQRPFFNVSFDLSTLGFMLPDNLFYGVAIDPFASVTSQSINMSLWNYGTADSFPPTDADYDGMVIKTGTDLSHEYWERGVDGSTDTFAGFTPNLILAAQVPEPNDLALAGIGLLAVALARRRRRDRAG